MKNLFNLLTDLGADPFMNDAFARDPSAVIEEFKLDPAERSLLSLLGHDGRGGSIPSTPWAGAFLDPGPDPVPDPDVPEFEE